MARTPSALSGYLAVDKPSGMTSHDVVARLRRVFNERRIGHGGTLDPDATGLLLVAVGRATRLLRYVSELDKSYVCELVLGATTTTLDDSGEITATFDMSGVDLAAVRRAAGGFYGAIDQVPPMVSALKVDGRRLYELAREGTEIERAPRRVEISRLEVQPTGFAGVYSLLVECSSGTYIRSLAADIGTALGGGAHLRALRRLSIGRFSVREAVPLELVTSELLRAPAELVGHLEAVEVPDGLLDAIATGRVLAQTELGCSGAGPWALHRANGTLVAIYEDYGEARAKPSVVLVERTVAV